MRPVLKTDRLLRRDFAGLGTVVFPWKTERITGVKPQQNNTEAIGDLKVLPVTLHGAIIMKYI